jgi:hypothetical protein
MTTTLCSKLCALPVCVMAWMASKKNFLPGSKIELNSMAEEFMKVAEMAAQDNLMPTPTPDCVGGSNTSDVPYGKERIAMMSSILKKMLVQTGLTKPQFIHSGELAIEKLIGVTFFARV